MVVDNTERPFWNGKLDLSMMTQANLWAKTSIAQTITKQLQLELVRLSQSDSPTVVQPYSSLIQRAYQHASALSATLQRLQAEVNPTR